MSRSDKVICDEIDHLEYLIAEMEAVGECGHIPPRSFMEPEVQARVEEGFRA